MVRRITLVFSKEMGMVRDKEETSDKVASKTMDSKMAEDLGKDQMVHSTTQIDQQDNLTEMDKILLQDQKEIPLFQRKQTDLNLSLLGRQKAVLFLLSQKETLEIKISKEEMSMNQRKFLQKQGLGLENKTTTFLL